MKVLVAQSCLSLCNSMDCSPPGSSVHGIVQTRILEWVAMPPPGDLPNPGIEPESLMSPALAGKFVFFFFLPLVLPGCYGSNEIILPPRKFSIAR